MADGGGGVLVVGSGAQVGPGSRVEERERAHNPLQKYSREIVIPLFLSLIVMKYGRRDRFL